MKYKSLLITASISLSIAVASLLGFSASNKSIEVNADSDPCSGTLSFDVTQDGNFNAPNQAWKSAVYFWNSETNGWSDHLVYVEANHGYLEATYNLSFTPTSFKLVRYNPDFAEIDWEYHRWGDNQWEYGWDSKPYWNESNEGSFATSLKHVILQNNNCFTNNTLFPSLVVYSTKTSAGTIRDFKVKNAKLGASNICEYYVEITLAVGNAFSFINPWDNKYYAGYSIGDGIQDSDFENYRYSSAKLRVVCNTAGTYELFFDIKTNNIHIANPTVAAGDAWAQDFLTGGCSTSKTNWDTLGEDFLDLDEDVRDLFLEVEHESDPNKELSGYIAKAVQRYDYVLVLYGVYNVSTNPTGFTDFMGRVGANKVTPKQSISLLNNSDTLSIIIPISLVSLLSISSLFIIRRKEHN